MNITLPSSSSASIGTETTNAIASFATPAIIVISVILAFFIIEMIVGLFHKDNGNSN